MNIERELIISILKLTKNGSISSVVVSKDAKIPSQIADNLLEKLQKGGLIYLRKNFVEADSLKRLKLVVRAIQLGADIERVSSFLQWKEFENIAAVAFERNGYSVNKNFRFKHAGRRWEIDVIGCKKPIAICVDCKHWHHGMYPSALKKIVEEQVERTFALAESLPELIGRIGCASWDRIKLVPAVLSLVTGRFKFYDDVPIVPVLQLQDFLSQLPAYADSLKHFSKRLAN
ncbi:MAG: restriction endonuclease [Candidatus Bathyarchaeota archaeon]|nr:restriction endonuclease [Candidatus Bathyarchaeota archaeon]